MTPGEPRVVIHCGGCGGRLTLVNVPIVPQADGTMTADLTASPLTALRLHIRYGCRWTPAWRKVAVAYSQRATGAG